MTLLDSQLLIGFLLVAVLLLIVWIIRIEVRYRRLISGTNKTNLESGLNEAQVYAREFRDFKTNTDNHLKHVEKRLNNSIQHVATIRFDPFKGSGHGGNQSFATALLDEKGNGVVISTIHTRERVGIFSKPIQNKKSQHELTPEESEAISTALEQR